MKNQTFDFTELFSQSYFAFSLNLNLFTNLPLTLFNMLHIRLNHHLDVAGV